MGGLGPSGVFGSKSYASQDWLSNYGVLKTDRFGGKPPVGGRPGARPLNPALHYSRHRLTASVSTSR